MSDEPEMPGDAESDDEPIDRPVGDLGYSEAALQLDEIINDLDQGVIDVDELDVRFRRAIDIVEELDRRIRVARDRVDALIPRLDAIADDQD